MKYFHRTLEPTLKQAAAQFPAIMLTGPRQSGKTTLLKHLFGQSHRYLSLEAPDINMLAHNEPRRFLADNPPPMILDEVQYAPELLRYIQEWIDEHREMTGQFLLTGSQNLLMSQSVSESLAGRVAVLRLHPFTLREECHNPDALPIDHRDWQANPMYPPEAIWHRIWRGSYPELATKPGLDPQMWQAAYLRTYLERDVRMLREIGSIVSFQTFLQLLASRSAQLLNLTDVAQAAGVALNTAKAWVSVLQATDQVFLLRPYFSNLGKRLVKTPKLYFTDTGLLCYLLGIRSPEDAKDCQNTGAIFETAVVSEFFRSLTYYNRERWLWFWRDRASLEVDLLYDTGRGFLPLEVKATDNPAERDFLSIRKLRAQLSGQLLPGFVIHSGIAIQTVEQGDTAIPLAAL